MSQSAGRRENARTSRHGTLMPPWPDAGVARERTAKMTSATRPSPENSWKFPRQPSGPTRTGPSRLRKTLEETPPAR